MEDVWQTLMTLQTLWRATCPILDEEEGLGLCQGGPQTVVWTNGTARSQEIQLRLACADPLPHIQEVKLAVQDWRV